MIFVALLKESYWSQTPAGKFQELKATGSVAVMDVATTGACTATSAVGFVAFTE